VDPEGYAESTEYMSLYLEALDPMWAPSVEYKFTLVNHADASVALHRSVAVSTMAPPLQSGNP
jgi:hypothetical protein